MRWHVSRLPGSLVDRLLSSQTVCLTETSNYTQSSDFEALRLKLIHRGFLQVNTKNTTISYHHFAHKVSSLLLW